MELLLLLTPLLFGLSFLSGMLGLGVAFIAIPVLGLFGYDLKDVIQPWALLLNGLTAISGAIAFWRAGMVDKRGALILVIITTVAAPVGVWLLQFASTDLIWWLYVGVLVFLAIRMALPKGASTEVVAEITDAARAKAAGAAVPISVFAGFLGVGPGFLLMPMLTLVGYSARLAAATNAVAVTLPSFSAFVSHLGTASFDWPTVIITSVASVIGAWLGARFTAGRVKSATLSRIFAIALIALAAQRAWVLVS
ncbi:MAG: sulfite exporter TauE/SafE family protein [Chloroflexota bacterium]